MLLSNRNVLITGGAKGIGRAIAYDMAKEGARIVLLDLDEGESRKTVETIQESGGTAKYVLCDITKQKELDEAEKEVRSFLGNIDVIVSNAGISIKKPVEEVDEQTWDKVVDINLKGSFLTVKTFLDHVKASEYGKIVFITSASAYTGTGGGISYVASKAGQNGMILTLAKELGPHGINVNGIAPRVIQTEMLETIYPDEKSKEEVRLQIPIRKIGQPEDVAYLTTFLSSDKAEYLHGQVIVLDGGRTYR
ncbi:MAG TPA: short-chain dehydrogenase [Eubacteriaceae bacterium]|nr:short-chain dehydrogenase [Eubacteriaceae bacterium]